MRRAIDETERRRAIQMAYNEAHGIVPKTVSKSVRDVIKISGDAKSTAGRGKLNVKDRQRMIDSLTKDMKEAARMLEFEYAAQLRDKIRELQEEKDG